MGSSSATWTALYIEPQSAGGTFTIDPASSLNLTGVDVAGGTYGTNLVFAVTYGSRPIVAIGTPGADTFTGTGEDEAYVGAAGNDIIDAGGGSDIALQGPGGGSDTFDGGVGTDTSCRSSTSCRRAACSSRTRMRRRSRSRTRN